MCGKCMIICNKEKTFIFRDRVKEFTRDKFTDVQVQVLDDVNGKFASAAVKISSAMSKLEKRINLDEYLQCIDYEINNFA